MKLEITTLIEDNPDQEGRLLSEHGLSLFIEVDGITILFDTGQSGRFLENAMLLQKDITALDYIILSHGHYDHTGGFERLVETIEKSPKLIVGAEFFNPKYKKVKEQEHRYIGNSFDENYVMQKGIPLIKVNEEVYYVTENILVFHQFRKVTDFESLNPKFRVGEELDEFLDEVVLGIVTEKGLVIVVGCSHVGVINILESISKKMGLPIYAVIGGTHLIDADYNRRRDTIASLRTMNVKVIAVSHCTGTEGIQSIREELKDQFVYNNTGNVISFDLNEA